MRILVTGSTGYIGTRLIEELKEKGHQVVALARNPDKVVVPEKACGQVTIIQGDLLEKIDLPEEIDVAYYLIHSMSNKSKDFDKKDKKAAQNFTKALQKTHCRQVIYLGGLISSENLSKHLQSRLEVEKTLQSGTVPVTVFRAGIIIGAGSASFKIIRALTEKLPIMVIPRWAQSRCQPIAICDVLFYLIEAIMNRECTGKTFDIGGPDILSYKEMLMAYARVRRLFRWITIVPLLTPKLSSYWLNFITPAHYSLARNLIESIIHDAVCVEQDIQKVLPRKCLSYEEAIRRALNKEKLRSTSSTAQTDFTPSII